MQKYQMVFTPTENLAEQDNAGAFLRDKDGNLLSSTLVSGKQSLDANITNEVAVSIDTTVDVAVQGTVQVAAASPLNVNISSSSGTIDTKDVANTAGSISAVSVNNVATRLDPSPLANRRSITVQNNSAASVFLGFSNAVTISTGLVLTAGSVFTLPIGPSIQLWAISANATARDQRIAQLS